MKFFSRKTRRPVSPKLRTVTLHLERLEERLVLSGFGPEDGAYIVEPWSGGYSDVQIQPANQKIVAAGGITVNPTTTSDPGVALARYDSVGNPDTSYGSGGLSTTTLGYGSPGLALQPDGKAVVAAKGSSGYFGAARFTTNGSLDTSFGSGGFSGVNLGSYFQKPTGVGLQSTGKIVVGGFTAEFPDTFKRSSVLARFKASGTTDSGTGGFGIVVKGKATGYTKEAFGAKTVQFGDVAIQQDDKVVAVGNFSLTGSAAYQLIVARYTAAGILDNTFNGSGYSVLTLPGISYTNGPGGSNGVAFQSDGKIVVVSTCPGVDGASDMLVVRYNTNGSLDTTFGGGGGYVRLDIDGTVSQTSEYGGDVTIQSDGKIVAVGSGSINVLVARLDPDGTPDSTFGSGGFKIGAPPTGADYHSFKARRVALQSDGSIIVAGGTDNGHPLLMRFLPTTVSPLKVAGGAAPASSHTAPLTSAQMQPVLTGVDISRLGSLDVRITELGASTFATTVTEPFLSLGSSTASDLTQLATELVRGRAKRLRPASRG